MVVGEVTVIAKSYLIFFGLTIYDLGFISEGFMLLQPLSLFIKCSIL